MLRSIARRTLHHRPLRLIPVRWRTRATADCSCTRDGFAFVDISVGVVDGSRSRRNFGLELRILARAILSNGLSSEAPPRILREPVRNSGTEWRLLSHAESSSLELRASATRGSRPPCLRSRSGTGRAVLPAWRLLPLQRRRIGPVRAPGGLSVRLPPTTQCRGSSRTAPTPEPWRRLRVLRSRPEMKERRNGSHTGDR